MLKIFDIRIHPDKEYGRVGIVTYSDGTVYEIWKMQSNRYDLYNELYVRRPDTYAKIQLLKLYLAATY